MQTDYKQVKVFSFDLFLVCFQILVALKTEMPYFTGVPAFCYYSSSSMVTTCSDTCFAMLQDVGIILSGIERNNHIFFVFLSPNYPWDNQLKQQNIIYHD